MGYVEFWKGYVEYWKGLHIDLLPAVAGGRGGNWRVATLATPSCLLRTARQAEWRQAGLDGAQGGEAGPGGGAGGLGGMAGRVGWRAGWAGWAGWGGGPGRAGWSKGDGSSE